MKISQTPPKLINFLKLLRSLSRLRFISISLHNTSLMQLGLINESVVNECLFHSTIQMLQFGLTTGSNNKLTLISQFDGISLKILKHVKEVDGETCLAHVSLSLFCSLRLEESDQISSEIVVSQPQSILYDIIPFIKSRKSINQLTQSNSSESFIFKVLKSQLNKTFLKCATLKLDNTSVKLVRESGQKALEININSIEGDVTKTNSSELEARLIISNVTMHDTNSIVSSSLSKVSLIAKFEREKSIQQRLQLFLVSEISSCHIVYNDEEIRYWLELMFNSKNSGIHYSQIENKKQSSAITDTIMKELTKFIGSVDIHDISFSVTPTSTLNQMVTYGLNHAKIGWVLNSDPLFREMRSEIKSMY